MFDAKKVFWLLDDTKKQAESARKLNPAEDEYLTGLIDGLQLALDEIAAEEGRRVIGSGDDDDAPYPF